VAIRFRVLNWHHDEIDASIFIFIVTSAFRHAIDFTTNLLFSYALFYYFIFICITLLFHFIFNLHQKNRSPQVIQTPEAPYPGDIVQYPQCLSSRIHVFCRNVSTPAAWPFPQGFLQRQFHTKFRKGIFQPTQTDQRQLPCAHLGPKRHLHVHAVGIYAPGEKSPSPSRLDQPTN
jgi:hypothetical protein